MKKNDVKTSSIWGTIAKSRFLKQHGTLDHSELPETDAHAVPKLDSPMQAQAPVTTEEEMTLVEKTLQEKIKMLKEQKTAETKPVEEKAKQKNPFYDDWND